MNHAITLADLLCVLGAIVGFFATAIGALMFMAGMMSDAGDDGTGTTGLIVGASGVALLVGCIIKLL